MKMQTIIEEFQKGSVTLEKSASLAKISIWEMIEIMKEEKIPVHYTKEDLEKDLETLE